MSPVISNPTPVVSLLPSGLPPRTFAWTVSSELLGFYFMFSLFFVSGPCARLSWPSRQLLSARYRTVSYRIVSFIVITDHVQITPTPLSLRLKEIYLYEPTWNSLFDYVVYAETVNTFKLRSGKFWSDQDVLYNYEADLHGIGNRK